MQIVLIAVGVYLLLGVVFGIAFLARGLVAVDPVASGSSVAFRLLILPGTAALWPVMAIKWSRANGAPAEASS
jgi:hypothetical protein